jgi:DNA-binding transcriptional LysR family regulator
VQRRVTIEVTNIANGASYVREGLGVAILPPCVVPDDPAGLVVKHLVDADLDWPLGVAVSSLRRPSAAARALLALIDEKVG